MKLVNSNFLALIDEIEFYCDGLTIVLASSTNSNIVEALRVRDNNKECSLFLVTFLLDNFFYWNVIHTFYGF